MVPGNNSWLVTTSASTTGGSRRYDTYSRTTTRYLVAYSSRKEHDAIRSYCQRHEPYVGVYQWYELRFQLSACAENQGPNKGLKACTGSWC